MAAKGPRESITLECTECKRRNYMTEKNKRNNTDRLEIVKYCRFCKDECCLSGVFYRRKLSGTVSIPGCSASAGCIS